MKFVGFNVVFGIGPQQQQQVRNQMQPHPGQISQGNTSNHSEQISGGFVPQSEYILC